MNKILLQRNQLYLIIQNFTSEKVGPFIEFVCLSLQEYVQNNKYIKLNYWSEVSFSMFKMEFYFSGWFSYHHVSHFFCCKIPPLSTEVKFDFKSFYETILQWFKFMLTLNRLLKSENDPNHKVTQNIKWIRTQVIQNIKLLKT